MNIYNQTRLEEEGEPIPVISDPKLFLNNIDKLLYVSIVPGWKTREIGIGNNVSITGGVGEIVWGISKEFPDDFKPIIQQLLHFGQFSNVGVNRTAGCGVFTVF